MTTTMMLIISGAVIGIPVGIWMIKQFIVPNMDKDDD